MEMILTRECIADIYYYSKEMNILLCDPPSDPDIVNIFILNKFAGYRDLIDKMDEIINKRKIKGNPIALTVVNGYYYAMCKRDVSDVDMDKDINKVKAAMILAWKERNPGFNPSGLNDIFY